MWNLQTHGSLEDNSLYRVTYRAETGARRFCGKSTSAWENRVGVHNKVESPALDGYFLSALFETLAINALLAERSNFCHSCWFKLTVRAAPDTATQPGVTHAALQTPTEEQGLPGQRLF